MGCCLNTLYGSQLAKMKNDFFFRIREIWGNFVKKKRFLSITASLQFESKNPFAHRKIVNGGSNGQGHKIHQGSKHGHRGIP